MRSPATQRPSRRAAATSLAAPLLLLALAACGDPGTGPGIATADGGATPSASASNAASEGDPVKFVECMRRYGIDIEMESGGPGKSAVKIEGKPGDEGKLDQAQRACREFAPDGGPGGGAPLSAEDQEKFLAFARCMREHGVPMPDPEFEGGGVKLKIGEPGRAELDRGKVEAAQKACRSILPEAGAGGPLRGGGPAAGGGA